MPSLAALAHEAQTLLDETRCDATLEGWDLRDRLLCSLRAGIAASIVRDIAALRAFAAPPEDAEEVEEVAYVVTDAPGQWESCRYFDSRKAAVRYAYATARCVTRVTFPAVGAGSVPVPETSLIVDRRPEQVDAGYEADLVFIG